MRAVIYARYSTELQSRTSVEDQVRICRRRIEQEGWQLTAVYSDRAMSGASHLRPGYQKLLEEARAGMFDVVLAESIDRLSRDQEHIASLYKQLSFRRIPLITIAEGEINELHVGLKGTMSGLYLKDLAQKTHRGLEGRVRQGLSAGGIAYGYDIVRAIGADGQPKTGERAVNNAQADIVRQIFSSFASGKSPRTIVSELNKQAIAGPHGVPWGASTIYGNWRRGTGILNNELYVGRLVWNRQRFVKDPQTGRRQAIPNPPEEWIIEDVPGMRIVDDELWSRVKTRQEGVRTNIMRDDDIRPERARRPKYLFSGLLKCGACGAATSPAVSDITPARTSAIAAPARTVSPSGATSSKSRCSPVFERTSLTPISSPPSWPSTGRSGTGCAARRMPPGAATRSSSPRSNASSPESSMP
ncbi:recombinase family protein [Aureimonas leprariae]|uniref:recombinase family protein n=1 Tax=Plantimonas leprariae TaxID=2615207 RepID=UPI001FEA570E|nr:recombinase family protein [Aureimonas leprariae]